MPGEKRWNKWRSSRASLWHSPGEPPEPLEPHTECQHELLQLLISTYFLPSSIIISLNLECGWLQPLVHLESAFYSLISDVAIYILKVLDLLLLIFSGVLDFLVSIVAIMSDSKTSPYRETNFLLLWRLVLFFMNKKRNFLADELCYDTGREWLQTVVPFLPPESLHSAAICWILNKPRSSASSCWDPVISSCAGGAGCRCWALLRTAAWSPDPIGRQPSWAAQAPGVSTGIVTGCKHLGLEGAGGPFWLASPTKHIFI